MDCDSSVNEPKNERQNRTDQESRSDWKIEEKFENGSRSNGYG